MATPALGPWPLRIGLALAGSLLSSLQLAVPAPAIDLAH